MKFLISTTTLFSALLLPLTTFASETGGGHSDLTIVFIWIAVMLLAAKFSSLIEKWSIPSVLGELFAGIVLGNLILFGFPYLEGIKHSEVIAFLAQMGLVILLFQIGLESDIKKMLRIGGRAVGIAAAGAIATFVLMMVALPYLFPDISTLATIFLSATFLSTSVGISARVFKDLKKTQSGVAQLVLGAAVFDDVIGLIILAVVVAAVSGGGFSAGAVSYIALKAIAFLVFSIIMGQIAAPYLGRIFSRIHTGVGMKFTLAISFALIFAFLAESLGLAPIIGAFAAGLVLDSVHFVYFRKPRIVREFESVLGECSTKVKDHVHKAINHHTQHDIEDLVEPLGLFMIPIFFVVTGMAVDLKTFADPRIFLIALAVTAVAIAGKLISGLLAPKGSRLIAGWGMVPRGEVQLIFAAIGLPLGIITDEIYTVIVMVILFTSLLTPIVLSYLIKKEEESVIAENPTSEII